MYGLQKLFDQLMVEYFESSSMCVRLIENKLTKAGIQLTSKQAAELHDQIESDGTTELTFSFSKRQLRKSIATTENQLKEVLEQLLSGLEDDARKLSENVENIAHEMVNGMVDETAKDVFSSIKRDFRKIIRQEHSLRRDFKKNISSIWGKAIELLTAFISLTNEITEVCVSSFEPDENNYKFNALYLLGTKAQQTSHEILVLLENGCADGAIARWRSLHELAVTACFIGDNCEELAKRFLAHEHIETYKGSNLYNQICDITKQEPISSSRMHEIEQSYQCCLDEFGIDFKYDYGWASKYLNKKRPTFRDIEDHVDLGHWRHDYKIASANIHAQSFGLVSRIGILPEDRGSVLLSGPSLFGLEYPAYATVISLGQTVAMLLAHEPSIDGLVAYSVLKQLGDYVIDDFDRIYEQLRQQRGNCYGLYSI